MQTQYGEVFMNYVVEMGFGCHDLRIKLLKFVD
jgi:hypothetical protein